MILPDEGELTALSRPPFDSKEFQVTQIQPIIFLSGANLNVSSIS